MSASPSDLPLGDLQFPIDVRIPSDVRYIERVVQLVARRCAESSLPARMCRLNIPVALTEALSNAILYGNGDGRGGVRMRAMLDDRALVFEITDEGSGFDLEACTLDPTLDENLVREDGRGLFLMRSLMDRVEQFQSGGNCVRLTLRHS